MTSNIAISSMLGSAGKTTPKPSATELSSFQSAANPKLMLNVHDLKAAYEHAIGHPTSNSTIYNLLNRHGWRKLMPRPFHPKRDIAAQKAFKKMVFPMP